MTDKAILTKTGWHHYLDGKEVSEEAYHQRYPLPTNQPGSSSLVGWKPLHSMALAVHPDQTKDATNDAASKGVPTNFDKDGCPIFESRSHRKRYMQAYGYYDRDGGYGDAQKQDRPNPIPYEMADL